MIFDNLENARLPETYAPDNLNGGSIIITTQHAHVSPITSYSKKLELQPLLTDPGSELFFKISERPPVDDEKASTAREIGSWVGGLPLGNCYGCWLPEALSFVSGGDIVKSTTIIHSVGELRVRGYPQLPS